MRQRSVPLCGFTEGRFCDKMNEIRKKEAAAMSENEKIRLTQYAKTAG